MAMVMAVRRLEEYTTVLFSIGGVRNKITRGLTAFVMAFIAYKGPRVA